MKIFSVSNTQYNNKVNFSSGKVHVYSDFDKTYLPYSHPDFVRNEQPDFVNSIRRYFEDFRNFLDRTREGLKFTITTGRTYTEFETMAEISRTRKFGMPIPDTLICKNGSDEYLRTGTEAKFYKGGYFPFDYKRPNIDKEIKLKEITGWDGKRIKEKLTELFKSHDLQIITAGSEYGPKTYGWRSMFSSNNLDYDQPNEWKVAFRNDGNCKMFYVLPADMTSNPERIDVLNHINSELAKFFRDNSMKVHSYSHQNPKECGGRPYFVIEPKVDDELSLHAPNTENSGLTKLYDTKEAVKKAWKNNDLVIVAGDDINDKTMLNPINYMLDELKKRNIDTSEIRAEFPSSFIKFMDKHPELYKIYKEMPFIGVIEKHIQDGSCVQTSDLDDLIQYFSKGKYKKIIVVENGKLKKGIKEAIKLYSTQNSRYKNELSEDLLLEVFKTTKEEMNKSKIISTCVLFGIGILGAFSGYRYYSNNSKSVNHNDNNITYSKHFA